ncbi:hypothetical protein GGX14DRAFT_483962 [Mycena pura]|uniref:Uncharacterized protein n=1 Tax=Mycena pura TaxID=153505 RepID=A0AAD6ULE4_9AGAR|nr:hypothetical protein GGX14DRAFT_483962 [Mycena pura]
MEPQNRHPRNTWLRENMLLHETDSLSTPPYRPASNPAVATAGRLSSELEATSAAAPLGSVVANVVQNEQTNRVPPGSTTTGSAASNERRIRNGDFPKQREPSSSPERKALLMELEDELRSLLDTKGPATRPQAHASVSRLVRPGKYIRPTQTERLTTDLTKLAQLFDAEREALWREGEAFRQEVESLLLKRTTCDVVDAPGTLVFSFVFGL